MEEQRHLLKKELHSLIFLRLGFPVAKATPYFPLTSLTHFSFLSVSTLFLSICFTVAFLGQTSYFTLSEYHGTLLLVIRETHIIRLI